MLIDRVQIELFLIFKPREYCIQMYCFIFNLVVMFMNANTDIELTF